MAVRWMENNKKVVAVVVIIKRLKVIKNGSGGKFIEIPWWWLW